MIGLILGVLLIAAPFAAIVAYGVVTIGLPMTAMAVVLTMATVGAILLGVTLLIP